MLNLTKDKRKSLGSFYTPDSLASKTIAGANFAGTSGEMYFAIPQIDWENIHINQKELWDKGLYDDAVLNEMGLKMEVEKYKTKTDKF